MQPGGPFGAVGKADLVGNQDRPEYPGLLADNQSQRDSQRQRSGQPVQADAAQ